MTVTFLESGSSPASDPNFLSLKDGYILASI